MPISAHTNSCRSYWSSKSSLIHQPVHDASTACKAVTVKSEVVIDKPFEPINIKYTDMVVIMRPLIAVHKKNDKSDSHLHFECIVMGQQSSKNLPDDEQAL